MQFDYDFQQDSSTSTSTDSVQVQIQVKVQVHVPPLQSISACKMHKNKTKSSRSSVGPSVGHNLLKVKRGKERERKKSHESP